MTPDQFTPGYHLPYHKWMKLSRITLMLIMKYQVILTKNIVRYIWKISARNSPEDIHAGYLQFIQMNSNPKISSYIVSKFPFFWALCKFGALTKSLKGQLNSEWIYEFIVSPKMPTKNYQDFCPRSLLEGRADLRH